MEYRLNSGMVFSKEYESDFSIIRRFIVANPGIQRQDFTDFEDGSMRKSFVFKKILEAQPEGYVDNRPWIFSRNWSQKGGDIFYNDQVHINNHRQCPQCARELFHSHAFENEWVKYCPIHGIELVRSCPECGLPWPMYREMFSRKCSTCGRVRAKSKDIRQNQSSPHLDWQNDNLEAIWRIVRGLEDYVYVIYSDYIKDGADSGVLKYNSSYPDIHVTLMPEYRSLFDKIGHNPDRGESKQFSMSKVDESELQSIFNNTHERLISKLIAQSSKEIDDAYTVRGNYPGMLCNKELPCLDFMHDFCPIYISIEIWKSIVSQHDSTHKDGEWWKRIFRDHGVAVPQIKSIPVLIYDRIRNIFYEPGNDYKKWMYLLNLKYLFMYIYSKIWSIQYFYYLQNYNDRSDIYEPKYIASQESYEQFKMRILDDNNMVIACATYPTWPDILENKIKCEAVSHASSKSMDAYKNRIYLLSRYSSIADKIRLDLNLYH